MDIPYLDRNVEPVFEKLADCLQEYTENFDGTVIDVCEPPYGIRSDDFVIRAILSGGVICPIRDCKIFVFAMLTIWLVQTDYYVVVLTLFSKVKDLLFGSRNLLRGLFLLIVSKGVFDHLHEG